MNEQDLRNELLKAKSEILRQRERADDWESIATKHLEIIKRLQNKSENVIAEIVVMKGDIVSCPDCKIDLLRVVRDIYKGDNLNADLFEGIHYKPEPQQQCICPECGGVWFNGRSLHIKGSGFS